MATGYKDKNGTAWDLEDDGDGWSASLKAPAYGQPGGTIAVLASSAADATAKIDQLVARYEAEGKFYKQTATLTVKPDTGSPWLLVALLAVLLLSDGKGR